MGRKKQMIEDTGSPLQEDAERRAERSSEAIDPRYGRRKDAHKVARAAFEGVVILALLVIVLRAFFVTDQYEPFDEDDPGIVTGTDAGFIAVSYLGVDRAGTDTLISTQRLEEQLSALRDLGYVTISQSDITDYYDRGKQLPEKALFLLFEDGRTDTAIFSEPILEKQNFLGTICSYADKIDSKDNKFLNADDLLELEKSTFWENGTNGYRLAYINVFDRYDRFLDQMSSWEFVEVNQYLGRDYNHYLMDYIRDENRLPVESYNAMRERISHDYTKMEEIYSEKLGYVPKTYVLMHANSDRFGNNERVSGVNEECMTRLFPMNFNRENLAVNHAETNPYDLTRLQAQAYWYTNHLLMRIWDDLDNESKKSIQFVDGDPEKKALWDTLQGASEFRKNSIVLTTVPESGGLLRLKDSENYQDIQLAAALTGNLLGNQTIYLRADDNRSAAVSITFHEKKMTIKDSGKTIAEIDLDELENVQYLSVEEDNRNALVQELETRANFAGSVRESMAYENESNEAKEKPAETVANGAEPYIPTIEIKDPGRWELVITLKGNRLSVQVNGRPAVDQIQIDTVGCGSVFLESGVMQGYSQRNIDDDVYDGVFEDLCIMDISDVEEDTTQHAPVLYDDRLQGWDKVKYTVSESWNHLLDWFIGNL